MTSSPRIPPTPEQQAVLDELTADAFQAGAAGFDAEDRLFQLHKIHGWDFGVTCTTAAHCAWACEVRVTPAPNRKDGPDRSHVAYSAGASSPGEGGRTSRRGIDPDQLAAARAELEAAQRLGTRTVPAFTGRLQRSCPEPSLRPLRARQRHDGDTRSAATG